MQGRTNRAIYDELRKLAPPGWPTNGPIRRDDALDRLARRYPQAAEVMKLRFFARTTLDEAAGRGWVQRKGGPVEEVHPGDVVWLPPGEKHWHGASPTTGMTHVAVQEQLDGKVVDWLEVVSDEQYRR